MHTQQLLTVTLEPGPLDCWAEESPASILRALAVRLHSAGLSLRETAAALELFIDYRRDPTARLVGDCSPVGRH